MLLSIFRSGNNNQPLSAREYREYFDLYYKAVRNFLFFKTGDEQLAEDIAQDTFVKLWENRDTIERKTVKAYLYTIAGNLAINQLKRQQLRFKYINATGERSENDSPEYLMMVQDFRDQLEQVLNSMPEASREVFLMNRLEDLKYREIAERLNISVKAVEKRMSKALQILREKLNIDV